jgi:hypothetical protein
MAVAGLDALDPDQIAPPLREPLIRYARLLGATSAATTLRGRRPDVRGYVAWTSKQGLTSLPPSSGILSFQIEDYLCRWGTPTRHAA